MTHPLSGDAIVARLQSLARHTDVPGEMTRLSLSPAHRAAVEVVTEAEVGAVDSKLESFLDVDTPADYDRVCQQLTYGKRDESPYTSRS
jgi:hypothetical protein